MRLPSLSSSMYVARLRYIQSIHEPQEYRGPDTLVRRFIPMVERWRTAWISPTELTSLRAEPFYYYLVARTRYYDQVITDAIADGVRNIVMVGCGTDTRAHRFQHLLRSQGVRVLECDQQAAIHIKQRMTRRWRDVDHIDYLALDLNQDEWPELEQWLTRRSGLKTLVMMEGVSVYVDDRTFSGFLKFLSRTLDRESHVAYDFKIRGVRDDFGQEGRTAKPFRLPPGTDELARFHEAHGLQLESMSLSSELSSRLFPERDRSVLPVFTEDGLVRLTVK
jgi:methyltransferase (TIGR00027 family)